VAKSFFEMREAELHETLAKRRKKLHPFFRRTEKPVILIVRLTLLDPRRS
jgi:hypothetical protein